MDKDNFADLINMMANNLDDVDVDEEKVERKNKLSWDIFRAALFSGEQ